MSSLFRYTERSHRAESEFHNTELQYYGMLSNQDAKAVALKKVAPGIVTSAQPGKERPGQFGTGARTDWATRYQWITGQLNNAIRTQPPADYKWQGLAQDLKSAKLDASNAPMVSYPEVTPLAAEESIVMGLPVLAATDPSKAKYDADGTVVGTALPYPAMPDKDSVYKSSEPPPAPADGGKPQAPRPKFELQMARQVAAPAAAPPQMMQVVVPAGVSPGQMLQVGSRVNPNLPIYLYLYLGLTRRSGKPLTDRSG